MVAVIGLIIGFRNSANMASAYGVAISTTMVITSILFLFVMKNIFKWSTRIATLIVVGFLIVDLSYFFANIQKVPSGGWFPLVAAGIIFLMMQTWRHGNMSEQRKSRGSYKKVREYLADIGGGGKYRRVPGQAVYLTSNSRGTPYALMHNIVHNHALHKTVILYNVSSISKPRVSHEKRLKIQILRGDIFRVIARYGFMEEVDVPRDLAEVSRRESLNIDLDKITYFVSGRILRSEKHLAMSWWRTQLYIFMSRGQERLDRFFNLPPGQVFETGAVIEM